MHDPFTPSQYFQKIHLHARPVIPFELGIKLVHPTEKGRIKMFLFHFEPQNIAFRIHIRQIGMKFFSKNILHYVV